MDVRYSILIALRNVRQSKTEKLEEIEELKRHLGILEISEQKIIADLICLAEEEEENRQKR